MPPCNFPLRWESTGEQWWFASPIDWAAANGHFDLVSELLHLDPNLLIKLTSLRRISRLETVWDDELRYHNVAKCRSNVARKLLLGCQNEDGENSLLRAGYGGWLLYTAASAGDLHFVEELLGRNSLLVFGEGEYGATDILYAAARSKNSEVFRYLLRVSVPGYIHSNGGDAASLKGDASLVLKWEMMNRAVHAAARGGNREILKELLLDCSDVLAYRDAQGSTILHTASGRGQVEVVEHILASYDIDTCVDNLGNTALSVASYMGYSAVVQILIAKSPASVSMTNKCGDTFLHMAIAGFQTPGFRRLDQQVELIKELVGGKRISMHEIINVTNSEGRTALHLAVVDNIQADVVEILMSVPSINLNIRDADGMTPLDLLKKQPLSASSKLLVKQLISAGGVSNSQDDMRRDNSISPFKMKGIGSIPGTSFEVPDAELFLHIGVENGSEEATCDAATTELGPCSGEQTDIDSSTGFGLSGDRNSESLNYSGRRLNALLQWPGKKERKTVSVKLRDHENSAESNNICKDSESLPTPLRKKFLESSSLPNNKRIVTLKSIRPSPSSKKAFAAGLTHGVIQVTPQGAVTDQSGYSSDPCKSPLSSFTNEKRPSISGRSQRIPKQASFDKALVNRYFCFGAQGLATEDSVRCKQ